MSIQKLHYENISGTLVRREGLLSWRCPLCKAEGQSPGVMHTCPECGSKEAALPGAQAQPAPNLPEGWLRAIDEALVVAHIGVANAEDTYEQAKAKLDSLIKFHVDVAIDPAVNGGWKLMPVEPTKEIYECFSAYDGTSYSNPFGFDEFSVDYAFALEAAPEAKP